MNITCDRHDRCRLSHNPRRSLLLEELLIVRRPPVVLEPIDASLERNLILLMEPESLRTHLDELFEHFLFRHIANHDMLRVHRKDCKAIRDASGLFFLLFFEASF